MSDRKIILDEIRLDPIGHATAESAMHLSDRVRQGDLNLDPEYQRGHVWTSEQAERFVGHLLHGGPFGLVVIQSWPNLDEEVVDGKQRISALLDWRADKIAAQLDDGRRVAWADLSIRDQRWLRMGGVLASVKRVNLSRRDVMRLYLRLNRGGTIHADHEIARVEAMLSEVTP